MSLAMKKNKWLPLRILSVYEHITCAIAANDRHHRRIASGFLWVSLFVIVGKLAGAAKEMAIAWRYGVSDLVDAFVLVISLLSWPINVWSSILTVVLIPLIARTKNENPATLSRFAAELVGLTSCLGISLACLVTWGIPILLEQGWLKVSPTILQQVLTMLRPLAWLLPLGLLISQFSAWTMACGKHHNTLLEGLPALILLVAIVLPPSWLTAPLVYGSLLGFALQAIWLAWPLRRQGELPWPRIGFYSPLWRIFFENFGLIVVGQIFASMTTLVDQLFTAQLEQGTLSTLSYANRIMALILGMAVTAISRATLPIFSEIEANAAETNLTHLVRYWLFITFFLGLVGLILGVLGSPTIVALLFERGSFNANDTQAVAHILTYMFTQLPFYFTSMVLLAAFAAKKQFRFIAISGIINLVVKVGTIYWLFKHFGIIGVVLSTSLMYAISFAYFYLAFFQGKHSTDSRTLTYKNKG